MLYICTHIILHTRLACIQVCTYIYKHIDTLPKENKEALLGPSVTKICLAPVSRNFAWPQCQEYLLRKDAIG